MHLENYCNDKVQINNAFKTVIKSWTSLEQYYAAPIIINSGSQIFLVELQLPSSNGCNVESLSQN